jgi:ribose transport system permease protein
VTLPRRAGLDPPVGAAPTWRVETRPAGELPRQEHSAGARLRHGLPVETWVAGCTVALWIALSLASPYFLTSGNVFNIMRQVSVDAIIAYGELFTIITAGIDLSVGSVAGLTGIVFAMSLTSGMNVGLAVIATLALGGVIGLVNGLAIARLGIPAFIVTLAGLQGYRGMTMLTSGGMTVAGLPKSLGVVANTSILGIPTMFVIMLGFAVASQYLLGATRIGRYLYAIGSNAEAARRVGINVTRATLVAYGLSALFATVGGTLLVSRLTMGNPNAGAGAELQAIAAAVVGGASLFGGRGTVLGCFVGAILFTTIGNGANLLGVSSFWQMIVEGLLIAGVVYLDNLQKRRSTGQ